MLDGINNPLFYKDAVIIKNFQILLLTAVIFFLPRIGFAGVDTNNLILDDPLSATYGTIIAGAYGGKCVGYFQQATTIYSSFVTDGTNYTILNDPIAAGGIQVGGISGSGIFGNYLDSGNNEFGFLTKDETNYVSFSDPLGTSGTGTSLVGVSGSNAIGYFVDGTGTTNAWYLSGTNFVTLFDPAGVTSTVIGISGLGLVGNYQDSSNNNYGYFFDGTNYTSIDYSIGNSSISPGTTFITGISGGTVVGYASDQTSVTHGFLWDVPSGTYTPVDDDLAVGGTVISGISGIDVVGNYIDGSGVTNGFLTTDESSYAIIDDPLGISGSDVLGIGQGTLYGTYSDSNGVSHNFITPDGVNYTTVDGPHNGTLLIAMSGSNATGTYLDIAGNTNCFFYDGTNFDIITPPESAYGASMVTGISGVNVAGDFADSNGTLHGFFVDGTNYTTINGPSNGALAGIFGISGNTVAGAYTNSISGNVFGFLTTNGIAYTLIYGPEGTNDGINTVNGISGTNAVGTYTDTNTGNTYGFVTGDGVNYTLIYGPEGTNVGINTIGGISGTNVVGTYTDTNTGNTYGFVTGDGVNYTLIYGPGGTNVGINTVSGISGTNVVGTFTDSNSISHGFLSSGTVYSTIDFPGSQLGATVFNGVSGNMIFGGFTDTNGLTHGFIIQRAIQSFTLPTLPSQTFGIPFPSTNLVTTNTLGLPLTYTVTGPATLSNNTLIFTGAGTVTLVANQAGNIYYYAASPVTSTITVAPSSQSITFGTISSQTYGVPFTVSPSSSSGLPVSVSVLSGPATNSGTNGTTITPTGVGTVTLTASQGGSANYLAAPMITNSFVVLQATQSIAPFTGITNIAYSTSPVTVTLPVASSGLPVSLIVSGAATNNGNIVTLLGAGTVTLTASQAGNSNYLAATSEITNFVVSQATQSIGAFGSIPNQTYGNAPFSVTPPTASSGLPVVLSVLSGPATITNNLVTITGAGNVTLAADQAGNSNYSAAKEVTTNFTVEQAAQTIASFTTIPNQNNLNPVNVTPPTASSGLPVTLSVLSGPATIVGDVVTPTSSPATITVAANQSGNSNYLAATQVTTSFSVGKTDQTIAPFSSIANQTYGNPPFNVTPPTASSGQPVVLSVLSGPATILGNTVTLTGVGTVVLAADQYGNATYGPAAEVTTSFSVALASQSIGAFNTIGSQVYGTPVTITPPTASSGLPVSVSVLSGPATILGNLVTPTGVGTVTLAANQSGNSNFTAASQVTTSFNITQASQSIVPFSIPDQTYGNAPFSVTPPGGGGSGNPVTLSILSGPATISNNVITITGAGSVTVAANQSGNSNYTAASQVTASFNVAQASQSITAFSSISNMPYSTIPITITPPTASSGLPVSVSVLSGPATILGNLVTPTGVGTVTLAANQSGNSNFTAASQVTTSFNITQASQSIVPFSIPDQTYGNAPFSVTPPGGGGSGNPVTLSILSGPATISNNVITITGAGSVIVAANQSGNSNYKAASQVTASFNVAQASQSITAFSSISNMPYSTIPITITPPTASSGLPVSVSVLSTNATISNNVIMLTGIGKVVLAANQAGNSNFTAASQVTTSFNITQASQSIGTFSIPDQTYGNAPFSVTPPTGGASGKPVVLSILSGPATITNDVVTITGAGTVVVKAAQAGNADYAAASPVTTSFDVAQATQSIGAFGSIPNQTYGNAPFSVTPPTASSGLPVVLSVLSGPATITNNLVTIIGAGDVTLAADQAGNSNYSEAKEVTTNFTVEQATQSIAPFTGITNIAYSTSPVTVTLPVASSGLPVSLIVSGAATNNGNIVTLLGAGTVTLTASQAGNSNYLAATSEITNFVVSQATQSIGAFGSIPNQTYGNAPFSVTPPTASSGLPVVLSVLSGPATITNNLVTITGAGDVTLAADQAGNSNYSEAKEVTTNFTVEQATQSIAPFTGITNIAYSTSPVTITLPVASSGLPVTLLASGAATNNGNIVTLLGAGTVTLTASQAGNSNYLAATSEITNFVVSQATQSIGAFGSIPNQTYGNAPFSVTPPTASSGLPVVLSVLSGPATITNNLVTITGAGDVTLAADQAGNSNYSEAKEVTTNFTVEQATQSIAPFTGITNIAYSTSPVTVTLPVASSGLPVSLIVSGAATNNGNIVTLLGAGTVTLTASQAGNSNYLAATSEITNFVVSQATQSIGAFGSIPNQTYGNAPFSVTPPTASSGLPVVLSVLSGPATITNNLVTITGAGNVTLAADQAGNSNYSAAKEVTTNFTVEQATQTIAPFTGIPVQKFTKNSSLAVTTPAGGASSEPVVLTVSTNAMIISEGSNNLITFTHKGVVTLTATQIGNSNYLAATPVSTNLLVGLLPQSITASIILTNNEISYSPMSFTIAKASSGLPVTISVTSGPAKVSAGKLLLLGVGPITLTANQSGNGVYAPASQVSLNFTVIRAAQSLHGFFTNKNLEFRTTPLTIAIPTATSGLKVSMSVSGPATISTVKGNQSIKLTLTGTGTVFLTATQSGTTLYQPVSQTATINVQ